MKKITVFMLAVVLLAVTACEDKEEEVFENVSKEIISTKGADGQNEGGSHGGGPGGD